MDLNAESSSSPIRPKKEIGQKNFEWLVKSTEKKEVDIPITIKEKSNKIQSNLTDFEWDKNIDLGSQNIKWAKLAKKDGNWHLILNYKLIPAKGFFNGCESANANLSLIASSIARIKAKPWWAEWSTENDCFLENAGKTLYLEKMGSIIEEPIKKKYESGKLTIRINRP